MKSLLTIFSVLVFISNLSADIIHVPLDQPGIQAGIIAAADGDTVLVADDIYYENINFLGKAITVASHFLLNGDTSHIANTIINGSLPGNPGIGSVVTFNSGEDTTSVLSGFTITGGSGTITEYVWRGQQYSIRAGGGIHFYFAGGRISNNFICNNNISQFQTIIGGGVCVSQVHDSPPYVIIENNRITNNSISGSEVYGSAISLPNGRIIDNEISQNISQGTAFVYGAVICAADDDLSQSVLLENNSITHNMIDGANAYGAGLSVEWKINASIIDNEISYNEIVNATTRSIGGGITVNGTSGNIIIDKNKISRNIMHENNSFGGGINLWSGNAFSNIKIQITDNVIFENQADSGAGINFRNSIAEVINNTIVNNVTGLSGGGIRIEGNVAIANIINSILWNNGTLSGIPQIVLLEEGSTNVRYSNIEGDWEGEGNINQDPLFADSLFQLSNNSPCIGVGVDSIQIDGAWFYASSYDFHSNLRPSPAGCSPDIGALESPLCTPGPGAIVSLPGTQPHAYELYPNYPNPFNPSTTIEFTLQKSGWVTLTIYNALGEAIAELVAENLSAGSYKYEWNAAGLASGIYYYRLEAGKFTETRKLVLMK